MIGVVSLDTLGIICIFFGLYAIISPAAGHIGSRRIPAIVRLLVCLLLLWIAHYFIRASIDLGS